MTISPKSDILNRQSEKVISVNNSNIIGEYYYYRKFGDHATNQLSTIRYGNKVGGSYVISDDLKYAYDSLGNISKVYENGLLQVSYTYDKLGRISREDNKKINKTYIFSYDNNGNIINKFESNYTTKLLEEIETLTSKNYSYASNSDKLLSYNGENCEYDLIGNPTTYRGKSAIWAKGRQLTAYNGITFAYNGRGQRTAKGSISFTYDSSGNLIKQSNGLEFIYDTSGICGFIYGGSNYLYRKNAQGDVISIHNTSGVEVASYIYDAWGNHKVYNPDGTENTTSTFIGNINPIRYRSYYYDTETGLFWVQSRYYDPEVGRFINADDVSYLDPETINGLNLYSYCGNDPVNRVDPTGHAWYDVLAWIGVGLVAAALTVVTLGAFGIAVGGIAGAIIGGAAIGTLIGAGAGIVLGAAGGMIYDAVQGNDFGTSIWAGVKAGFGIGAIAGAVIGGAWGGISYTPSGLSKGAINQGVKRLLSDPNKMNHILGKAGHNLSGYTAKTAGALAKNTLVNGAVGAYKSVQAATWLVMNSKVTFTIINGAIMIGDMWIF